MSVHVSKFLSLVLRHDPARFGVVLGEHGWTGVDALLVACARHGTAITRAELEQIVAISNKQRFALSPDGTEIRANQGHSVDVDLDLPRVTPPAMLYHGTAYRSLPGIHAHGLVRRARHHLHLSGDAGTAANIGARHGRPIVLKVRAAAMASAGHVFQRSANGVWLVDCVPVAFIEFPVAREHGHISSAPRAAIAKQTLSACEVGHYDNALGARVELELAIAAAREGTVLHELDVGELVKAKRRFTTAYSVTNETTIAALRRLSAQSGGHLACLNFASARNPGGGFLGGAQAQEESLARSSALYLCQCAHRAFYDRNRAYGSVLYLDLALFSPKVPLFRDDIGAWLEVPVLASVITCPAPNAGALRHHGKRDTDAIKAALHRRAGFVLAIAAHHGVERLVLGAWGAGVFGNDPAMVAEAFRDHLHGEYAGVFAEVTFAVIGEHTRPNHRAFADAFGACQP